jgi:hypothetical protein
LFRGKVRIEDTIDKLGDNIHHVLIFSGA